MKHYDVIVIGSGAANIIQEEALKQGLRVAQIEKGKWGGTCLTRGCIPTKVMTTAADRLLEIEESRTIGIQAEAVHFDWEKISQRTWAKINVSKALRQMFAETPNLDLYDGTASFVSDKVLSVAMNDGTIEELTADKIFIGTGGKTNVPKIEGLEEIGYLKTESFFGEKFPQKPYESLIIIGGGAISVEFAHLFSAFGTQVSIVQRNVRLLPKEDEESSALLLDKFIQRGIDVHLNQLTLSARMVDGKKVLRIQDKTTKEEIELAAEEILVAPGITSTADLLKLESTKIKTNEKGWILTNEFLETSVEGIYAFGDINGLQQFRHKANYEADILAHNHFMGKQPEDYRWARYDRIPAVTFTYPQVAHIGMTEKEALATGRKIQVGKNYYSATTKGFALGFDEESHKDFAKVIIDADTKEILGFHAVGYEASTLIQPFVNLMTLGRTELLPIHEEIASETTKRLRAQGLVRKLKPGSLTSIRESLVPHPALSEVGIWTYYYLEDKE